MNTFTIKNVSLLIQRYPKNIQRYFYFCLPFHYSYSISESIPILLPLPGCELVREGTLSCLPMHSKSLVQGLIQSKLSKSIDLNELMTE